MCIDKYKRYRLCGLAVMALSVYRDASDDCARAWYGCSDDCEYSYLSTCMHACAGGLCLSTQ